MEANPSSMDQQRVITTISELNKEMDDLLISNQTNQSPPTNDQLISSFLEIAAGQSVQTARQHLESTNWNIEEAINLFLINNNSDFPMYSNHNQVPVRSEETSHDNDLFYKGYFEDAKYVASERNRWLIVNVQSREEFHSYILDRDVWSNEAVLETLGSSFILWQVYDDTEEGQKVLSYYRIESRLPVVLVIDPITGKRMRMWNDMIEAQSLLEDLISFTEGAPHEYIASLTRNITLSNNTDKIPAPSWGDESEEEDTNPNNHVAYPSWGEEFEEEDTNPNNHVESPSWGEEFEEEKTVISPEEEEEETCLEFMELTEEPKADSDRSEVCSLCVRFPDGRRKQRKFFKSEPIQLLWSFCYAHMEESERKKTFKLVQAIPGASKTLDYEAKETFEESGVANSMISITW